MFLTYLLTYILQYTVQHSSHGILNSFNSNSCHQAHVLVRLQAYQVHTVLGLIVMLILPTQSRLLTTRWLWSTLAAELMSMTINVLVCLLLILTVASSVIKLMLVAKFNWVFAQEPQQLARRILRTATVLTLDPNLANTLWLLLIVCNHS